MIAAAAGPGDPLLFNGKNFVRRCIKCGKKALPSVRMDDSKERILLFVFLSLICSQ